MVEEQRQPPSDQPTRGQLGAAVRQNAFLGLIRSTARGARERFVTSRSAHPIKVSRALLCCFGLSVRKVARKHGPAGAMQCGPPPCAAHRLPWQ